MITDSVMILGPFVASTAARPEVNVATSQRDFPTASAPVCTRTRCGQTPRTAAIKMTDKFITMIVYANNPEVRFAVTRESRPADPWATCSQQPLQRQAPSWSKPLPLRCRWSCMWPVRDVPDGRHLVVQACVRRVGVPCMRYGQERGWTVQGSFVVLSCACVQVRA